MTKLLEWLSAFGIIFAVWLALITKTIDLSITRDYNTAVFYSPLILVLLLGLYSATVVLYRTFTFNNCEEAAEELQKEIQQARQELAKLGYQFPKEIS